MRRSPAQKLASKQNWRAHRIRGLQKQAELIISDLEFYIDPAAAFKLKAGLKDLYEAHLNAVNRGQ
jgi:hypothetical protein